MLRKHKRTGSDETALTSIFQRFHEKAEALELYNENLVWPHIFHRRSNSLLGLWKRKRVPADARGSTWLIEIGRWLPSPQQPLFAIFWVRNSDSVRSTRSVDEAWIYQDLT